MDHHHPLCMSTIGQSAATMYTQSSNKRTLENNERTSTLSSPLHKLDSTPHQCPFFHITYEPHKMPGLLDLESVRTLLQKNKRVKEKIVFQCKKTGLEITHSILSIRHLPLDNRVLPVQSPYNGRGEDWVIPQPPLSVFHVYGCRQHKTNLHSVFFEHSGSTTLFTAADVPSLGKVQDTL